MYRKELYESHLSLSYCVQNNWGSAALGHLSEPVHEPAGVDWVEMREELSDEYFEIPGQWSAVSRAGAPPEQARDQRVAVIGERDEFCKHLTCENHSSLPVTA